MRGASPVAFLRAVCKRGAHSRRGGELGAQCEVPAGATGLKIYRVILGSPPMLLATLTEVTALPHLLIFTPDEEVSVFLTATNAGGESDPSTTVTATAP